MSRPVWFVNLLKAIYPGRRFFARLTNLPLVGDLVDHLVFRGDDMFVLPIDQTIKINAPLDIKPTTTG